MRSVVAPDAKARLLRAGRDAQIPAATWEQFDLGFKGDIDTILATREADATELLTTLKGQAADIAAPTKRIVASDADLSNQPLALLQQELDRLRRLAGIDEQNAKVLNRLAEKIQQGEAAIGQLKRRIEDHGGAADRATALRERRRELYAEVFQAICDEQLELEAWIEFTGLANVRAPLDLDVCCDAWDVALGPRFDAIVSLNMIHIAPWAASVGLFAGASELLGADGMLFLYGPFMRAGVHTAASNAAFGASLKARDPSWGVRDMVDLECLGQASGLLLRETIEMPANNFVLVFVKR